MTSTDATLNTSTVPAWHAWAETIGLTLAGPLMGLWLHPHDPLFVESRFCWPLLGPLLASLRYGSRYGFVAAGLLLTAMFAQSAVHVPGQIVAAVLAVTLIAGELSDRAVRRYERAERITRLATDRMERFIRRYHAMTASHEILERHVRKTGSTLREALTALRLRLATQSESGQSERKAEQSILDLFAEFAGVQVAAFHSVGARGEIYPPETTFGAAPILLPTNAMLQKALQSKSVVSVPPEQSVDSGVLAVVPLVDVSGNVAGLIAIHEMPFVAISEDNLQLMAVLGGTVADLLVAHRRAAPETEHQSFVTQLRRALTDRKRYALEATLVCVAFDGAQNKERQAILGAERRASDLWWVTQDAMGNALLAVLLPLTGEAGGNAFASRLNQLAGLAPGSSLTLNTRVHPLSHADTIESLVSFIREPKRSQESRRLHLVGLRS